MTENMDADPFNISLRKFLKQVGVTSQRAVEELVAQEGVKGSGRKLTLRAVLTAEGTDLHHVVEGEIDLG
jgi:16S rRNA U516 pseudouridylate synthase RsuA-like enzyme